MVLASGRIGQCGDTLAVLAGRSYLIGAGDSVAPAAIAARYGRSGQSVLDEMEGNFALALWNRGTTSGILAQDQLGGRSLFICNRGRRLVFASEVALLLTLLDARPAPDGIALAHWLADHRVHDGRTLYRGIRRLGAGRMLALNGHQAAPARTWWSPRYRPPLRADRGELATRLRTAIESEVARALEPGQANALLVSGGLDSAVVAALAARSARRRRASLRPITGVFPGEPEFDESPWARRLVSSLALDRHSAFVPIDDLDALSLLGPWLEAWQLPLPTPGLLIERPLIEAAGRDGATAVLDGQGGDELFGIAGFLLGDRLRHGRLVSAWQLARRYPEFGARPLRRDVARLLRRQGLPAALPYAFQERRQRGASPVPVWLRPELAAMHRQTADPWGWKRRHGALWWRSLADMLTTGREVADIADYVRRRARLSGLDGRSPLLSRSLVELVLATPPEYNFDPRWTRSLVRESMRGILPDDIRCRVGKTSFARFYFRAMSSPRSVMRIREMLGGCPEIAAYVNIDVVRTRLLGSVPRSEDPGWLVWLRDTWHLVSVEAWLQHQTKPADRALD